ncbi:MAG: hypothetical protein ACM3PY_11130 [Omnitrophica WOR_2 bacterium]
MNVNPLFNQVKDLVNTAYLQTGVRLDERLTGYSISDAIHLDIDPAIEAVVNTELRMRQRVSVDLRELVEAAPPVEGDNFFTTFQARSANFHGGNAEAFGVHISDLELTDEVRTYLNAGVFIPGSQVEQAFTLIVFLKTPNDEIDLAKTGMIIGLDGQHRLVTYTSFQIGAGLSVDALGPPSRLDGADRPVMLYVFLTLTAFMAVNQGEAPLRWVDNRTAVIG